jgi:hypothetical protein
VRLGYSGPSTTIINPYPSTECVTFVNTISANRDIKDSCLGIAYDKSASVHSHLMLRFEKEKDPLLHFSGVFSKPGNQKGRKRLLEKLRPLLESLVIVEEEMEAILSERGLSVGADVVVMVGGINS